MSSVPITAEKLHELLQCSLCLDMYKSPRAFKCLHTFCDSCITEHIKKTTQDAIAGYDCPYCRKFSPESEIKANFHVAQLTELYHEASGLQMCAPCGVAEAHWKCLDCAEYFCDACKIGHLKIRILSHHAMAKIEEIGNKFVLDRPIPCNIHRNELLKYNCIQCEELLCITCALLEHKGHAHETIEDALRRHVPVIQAITDAIKERSWATKSRNRDVKRMGEVIQSKYAHALKQAQKQRDRIVAQAAARYDDIEKRLRDMRDAECAALDVSVDRGEREAAEMDVIVSSTHRILSTARNARLLNEIQNNLLPKATELREMGGHPSPLPQFKYPYFKPNQDFNLALNAMGTVHALESFPHGRYVNYSLEQILLNAPHKMKTLPVTEAGNESTCRMACGFGMVAACFHNAGRVVIYTTMGDAVAELSEADNCRGPRSVAFLSEDKLVLATNDGLYVQGFRLDKEVVTLAAGAHSDVTFMAGHIYALRSDAPAVIVYNNVWRKWQQHSTMNLGIAVHEAVTLVPTPFSVYVSDNDGNIHVFSRDGKKLSTMHLKRKSPALCAVTHSNDCLIAYTTRRAVRDFLICTNKTQKDCDIPQITHPLDLVFQDQQTFWVVTREDDRKHHLVQFQVNDQYGQLKKEFYKNLI